MSIYDGFLDFREVPGKASEIPRASLGGSRGSPGNRQSVPGGSPGSPRGIPGGPWEVPRAWGIPKGILFGDRGPFCGIPGWSQGVLGASLGGLCEVPGKSRGFLRDPWGIPGRSQGPRWGSLRSLRRDFVFRPQNMQQRHKS